MLSSCMGGDDTAPMDHEPCLQGSDLYERGLAVGSRAAARSGQRGGSADPDRAYAAAAIITLGLFLLVINALMLMLVSALVKGFKVNGFLDRVLRRPVHGHPEHRAQRSCGLGRRSRMHRAAWDSGLGCSQAGLRTPNAETSEERQMIVRVSQPSPSAREGEDCTAVLR